MPAQPFHRVLQRPRLTALAVVVALVLGVLAATTPGHRASAAEQSFSLFPASMVPAVPADSDKVAVELGMKFTSSAAGTVTGVRFYKSSTNLGTHTGSLWDGATGSRLATVTFTGETASGWQQASFATPVAIVANKVYIISYLAPRGQYANDDGFWTNRTMVSGPLTGLADMTSGANGVYRYGSGGGFPQSAYKATNYYVDVIFSYNAPDTVKPTITSQAPAAGATGVSRAPTISATFSEPVDPATIVTSLTTGTAPNTTTVATNNSYNATTRTLTLRPTSTLANTTAYTVTVSGAKDTSSNQNQMDPVSWSFTTAADPGNCPCTLLGSSVPATPVVADNSAINLGVRFSSSLDGYITALRFYKGGAQNSGTHTGSLWNSSGVKIASVIFGNETDSGWQTATLAAPVAITKDTVYLASYYAPVGFYAASGGVFANPVTSGPLTAPADSDDPNNNGLYDYGIEQRPTHEFNKTNYFADVVFDTSAADGVAPTVTAKTPAANSNGIAASATVSATFSEPVVDNTAVISLKKSSDSTAVAGSTSYSATDQKATFTPSAALAYSTQYTVTVSGAKDAAGNVMTATTWTFTTAAEPPGPPDVGPGGPIAVITSSANPYTKYYAEILKTEGLNEFATIDVSTISASTLAAYDTVLLGEIPVTAAQASTLSTWVNGGGNLIAMKPSATLSSLLGLTSAGSTLSNGYIKVDPATKPGAGIVSETIQYHGTADRYTANSGTTTVAALYSDATTAAGNPAVTLRTVGTAGGEAAAFTYDLAKSIALTRQGNIAWAGTERDNYHYVTDPNVIRSDDMFFGGASDKDWIDFNKVAIPQADEQQRLLANLIQTVNRDKKPLPRFWYFPDSAKAVIVATGDDHGNNGTQGRFDQWNANSPTGCDAFDANQATLVANWKCLRYSSYLYNNTPFSDPLASAYTRQGFEVGLHGTVGVNNYTPASIAATYADQMAKFRTQYPSLPNPRTTRLHAIVFSDWSSQPKVEINNGMNMDTNYYYWPDTWVTNRPGFMTGSGMAMRFTDTDGSIIDNYQAATQMTDESGQTYPFTVDTLLDNALDATKGYYGSFVANMHTDQATETGSDALIASSKSHGNVPIISAKQLTDWLDGRNSSSYSGIAWNASAKTLTFTVKVGNGANNLVSMIPTAGPSSSTLSAINQGTTPVAFTKSTIKGLEYASFKPTAATYTVSYTGSSSTAVAVKSTSTNTKQISGKLETSSDVNGGTVQTAPDAATTSQTAAVNWTTSKPASTQVLIGTSPDKLAPAETTADTTTQHTATVDGLKPSTTYYYRVVSTDSTGQTVTSPATDQAPAKLATSAADLVAPVASDIEVTPVGNNAEVTWTTDEPAASGVRVTTPGSKDRDQQISRKFTTDHAFTLTDLKPDTTYVITIGSQDVAGNRALSKAARFVTPSPGTGQSTAAAFRTGRTVGDMSVSDTGDGAITLTGLPTTDRKGAFVSNLLDARRMVTWDRATFGVKMPTGASGSLEVRTGSTSDQKSGWTDWTDVTKAKRWRVDAASRFLQYRITLSAPAATLAPAVYSIGFSSNSDQIVDPTETGGN